MSFLRFQGTISMSGRDRPRPAMCGTLGSFSEHLCHGLLLLRHFRLIFPTFLSLLLNCFLLSIASCSTVGSLLCQRLLAFADNLLICGSNMTQLWLKYASILAQFWLRLAEILSSRRAAAGGAAGSSRAARPLPVRHCSPFIHSFIDLIELINQVLIAKRHCSPLIHSLID